MGCTKSETKSFRDNTFSLLESIRIENKNEILDHFQSQFQIAGRAANDPRLIDIFLEYYNQGRKWSINSNLEYNLDKHFVEHYGEFYDLLFLDTTGFVFHSIRQESDYKTTLISDTLPVKLAKSLKSINSSSFIDYEHYCPSDEPAAFMVTPVNIGTSGAGWLVFQEPINRVNAILTNRQGMGRTGEVYLVNSKNVMLSESRFIKGQTVLRKKIRTEAINTALREKHGNKIIADYRNVPVFSSFEIFDLLGTDWIIIAEIDEAEVLTEYYRQVSKEIYDNLITSIKNAAGPKEISIPRILSSQKVDMNEFVGVRPGQTAKTKGVSTCTAVAISFPGKFSYLAHISPTDISYESEDSRFIFGDDSQNLLGRLLQRILYFDIYNYEIDSLSVTLVATHEESYEGILKNLFEVGIKINQIKFLFNPAANYVDVIVDPVDGQVTAEWYSMNNSFPSIESDLYCKNLEQVFKRTISYARELP
ncbi:MAG: cache domain-containing protein [candidate division Zixibacteria bacterium]